MEHKNVLLYIRTEIKLQKLKMMLNPRTRQF